MQNDLAESGISCGSEACTTKEVEQKNCLPYNDSWYTTKNNNGSMDDCKSDSFFLPFWIILSLAPDEIFVGGCLAYLEVNANFRRCQ
jgi:hypothetical protein